MSYLPNIERRDTYWSRIADEVDAYAEEQQKLADLRADERNRVQAAIKGVRMDHDMTVAVLEALAFAAMRDKVLCEADLSMLDEAQSFIGGVA
jgi:hypothetical protein